MQGLLWDDARTDLPACIGYEIPAGASPVSPVTACSELSS